MQTFKNGLDASFLGVQRKGSLSDVTLPPARKICASSGWQQSTMAEKPQFWGLMGRLSD